METTMWITKDEASPMINEQNANINAYSNAYVEQNQQYTVDDYCQDLDNLVFSLDEFFMPTNAGNCINFPQQTERKPQTSTQGQHKILASMLASEPMMSTLTVKTEDASPTEWSNAQYNCSSPDSGINMNQAFSPNSDVGSSCSASPGMDLESPGSVASSFSSAGSTDSGIFMGPNAGDSGFEIYHDLIMRHLVQDIKATCIRLSISQDPKLWTATDCRAWLTDMAAQYHLTQVPFDKLNVNGSTLSGMTLAQFNHCFPNGGETVHAQLQIWNSANEYCKRQSTTKASMDTAASVIMGNQFLPPQATIQQQQYKFDEEMPYMSNYQQHNGQFNHPNGHYSLSALLPSPGSCSDSGLSVDLDTPVDSTGNNPGTGNNNNIHLWQFLRELLDQEEKYNHCVRWIDHSAGIFKIEDSHKLARLWGQRKNRPAMNYDKLSRSLRQYYKKNILKKTTRSQRLVYQFLHPYHMC